MCYYNVHRGNTNPVDTTQQHRRKLKTGGEKMNKTEIEEKKKMYLDSTKKLLDEAQHLLTDAEEWDCKQEELWRSMIHTAECNLTKAIALEEILQV